jgi:uncharacterized damage-inducible protein DinB
MLDHFRLLAQYNQWMNEKLYQAAASLPVAELSPDRGAFFGSILGTLNHLVVGDTIWLKRFAAHPGRHAALDPVRHLPMPAALDQLLFADLASLAQRRQALDMVILEWVNSLSDTDLAHSLAYNNTKGEAFRRRFSALLLHFFNHQTHHRGQVTTLLSQAGQDIGTTDLLTLIPAEGHAAL